MFAMGSVLVGVGVLLSGLLMLLFRRPEPPRWTRPELVAMLVTVPLTCIIGVGLGYMLIGGHRLVNGAGDPFEMTVPFGVAIVVAGLWRAFGIRRRLRAYAAASPRLNVHATETPVLATGDPPGRPSRRSTRKAA